MSNLDFTGQTVVITGAGGGIGRVYSLAYAKRGANVVVNDFNAENANKVVEEIKAAGGKAVANTSSVTDGESVIKTAVDTFGTVTILINNAGILRDKSVAKMSDKEWDQITEVHLKGAFACSKAAWPIFRKQKFGRIINTASAAGLYGNMGQANYSAAKMGLVTFSRTLSIEGAKYNIKATSIAPMAASAMTETIMPPEMLANLKPEFVAPLVLALTHPDGPDAAGKVFEVGAGFVAEIRWERSKGAVFKTDESFSPSAVAQRFSEIIAFEDPEHPKSMTDKDMVSVLKESKKLPTNKQSDPAVRFDGQTVIITGAGAGLGKAYALMFSKLGANVVINDVSEKAANALVEEIKAAGGKAAAAISSAEDGDAIVAVAMKEFGGVHALVNNAGILRDKSFTAQSPAEWDAVIAVHLRGTYKCTKAVWPIFQKQKYGRILNTSSGVGIYGNFGQANYSTAKGAIIGFTRTCAIEGKKYGILSNALAPSAGTAMTQTIWPQEMVDAFKPDFVAPVVGYLISKNNETENGSLFEVSGGHAAKTRWQRSYGFSFPPKKELTPEAIIGEWKAITGFDENATNPTTTQEAFQQIMSNFADEEDDSESSPYADSEDTEAVAEAKKNTETGEYEYTERDVLLYNLGIGAKAEETKWTFEGDDDFAALPSFGVIPQFGTSSALPFDFLPNFNPAKLLHGEQYLSIKKPIPTSGSLTVTARVMEVLDKGKAAAVTAISQTHDKASGDLVFETQQTVFIRGSGGFGGKKSAGDRGPASAANPPPKRKADAVVEEKVPENAAAIYRLSGDYNPLHISSEFAAIGGFDKPILHGLASMGYAGKHIVKTFGNWTDIKVRFSGVVYPGETLVTSMWKEGDKVIFETKTKERNSAVLSAAAVTLASPSKAKL